MPYDSRIDHYIDHKADLFAKPILQQLRLIIHKAIPNIEENIKWGMPVFEYRGIICNMAAFKTHVSFGFWKAALLHDPHGVLQANRAHGGEAMGNLGQIRVVGDLPKQAILIDLLKQAKALNEQQIKLPARKISTQPLPDMPEKMMLALSDNIAAQNHYMAFSMACKREYLQWITEAKTSATQEKRIAQAIEWIAAGKKRHWKYEK